MITTRTVIRAKTVKREGTRMAERGKDIAAGQQYWLQAGLENPLLLGTEMKTKPLPVSHGRHFVDYRSRGIKR
jgi:hypothetical protein